MTAEGARGMLRGEPATPAPARQSMTLRRPPREMVRLRRLRCREGMTRSEAEDLVATALELAMARDGSSGGVVRLVTITEKGAERRCVAV